MPVERTCGTCGRAFRVRPSRMVGAGGATSCSRGCAAVRKAVPLAERFWRRVRWTETRWLWTGGARRDGAGVLAIHDGPAMRRVRATRLSWELHVGPLPPGRRLQHACRRPACVRPDHLYPVRVRQPGEATAFPSTEAGRSGRFASGRVDHRRAWWTRERVLEALRRFHADTGQAPPTSRGWDRRVAEPGDPPPGRRRYPSAYAVLRHFPTFRAVWEAAGVTLPDRRQAAWTATEDWFVLEAIGVLPTAVIAAELGRGEPAIRGRARKLGRRVTDARGWSLKQVAERTGLTRWSLERAVRRGQLPVLRGATCLYVDPGDLVRLDGIDWATVAPDLVRSALRRRLVGLLAARADGRPGSPAGPG